LRQARLQAAVRKHRERVRVQVVEHVAPGAAAATGTCDLLKRPGRVILEIRLYSTCFVQLLAFLR
jgi:hypothetical protein